VPLVLSFLEWRYTPGSLELVQVPTICLVVRNCLDVPGCSRASSDVDVGSIGSIGCGSGGVLWIWSGAGSVSGGWHRIGCSLVGAVPFSLRNIRFSFAYSACSKAFSEVGHSFNCGNLWLDSLAIVLTNQVGLQSLLSLELFQDWLLLSNLGRSIRALIQKKNMIALSLV
jgi:hypothetical protein